ncbi:hypothetical protein KEM55_002808 [Ascosphaera atra]|nr:hypothetical protein KEM55_002808 [Ascosphaera atra]
MPTDRPAHRFVRDVQEPRGHLFGRAHMASLSVNLLRQSGKLLLHDLSVEGLVFGGSKDLREEVWNQTAQEQVRIRYCKWPSLAIARRPRVRGRALRSNGKEPVAPEQDGAAARGDGVDVELRALNGHSRSDAFEDMFQLATVARDVRRCPAHVEAHDGGL